MAKTVSFLGDSYTSLDYGRNTCMWFQVAANGAGLRVVGNYAVSGWNTHHIIEGQLPKALADESEIVAMMSTANDWAHGADAAECARRVRSVIRQIRSAGKIPVMVQPPLLGRKFNDPDHTWPAYRQIIVQVAQEEGCIYSRAGDALVDITTADGSGPLYRRDEFDMDGTHFQPYANFLIGKAAVPALIEAAGGRQVPTNEYAHMPPTAYLGQWGSAQFTCEVVPDDSGLFPTGTAIELRFPAGSAGGLGINAIPGLTDEASLEPGDTVEVSYSYRVMTGISDRIGGGGRGMVIKNYQTHSDGWGVLFATGAHSFAGDEGVETTRATLRPQDKDLSTVNFLVEAAHNPDWGWDTYVIRIGNFGVRKVTNPALYL